MKNVQNTLTHSSHLKWRRFAGLTPEIHLGDIEANYQSIVKLYTEACAQQTLVAVTPELALTGYGLGDMHSHQHVLDKQLNYVQLLAQATKNQSTVLVVGAAIVFKQKLYNCAVVMARGKVIGIVPKQHLPNYSEFYEQRWFVSGKGLSQEMVMIDKQVIPFGADLLFAAAQMTFGIEICEDLWTTDPPSRGLTEAGAEVILNLSASPDAVGKDKKRRDLVTQTSERLMCGYVYASSDMTDSTTDIVMSGHGMIAELGSMLNERESLTTSKRILIADIDISHIQHERRNNTSYHAATNQIRVIDCQVDQKELSTYARSIKPHPFIPEELAVRREVCEHILKLQSAGLAMRTRAMHGKIPLVIGLSGGLDSTLALLVAAQTCRRNNWPMKMIHTISMPTKNNSKRTRANADLLARAIGTTHQVIPIEGITKSFFGALSHDETTEDITFENIQARARTTLLFDYANKVGGLVVGTGDMSELALGWCTFNGDHMSSYAVNGGVPKTLVQYIVRAAAEMDIFSTARIPLLDILDTPISPELKSGGAEQQSTESLIGPYELHDFFLYHLLRWGSGKSVIFASACIAFENIYTQTDIKRWLDVFCKRFVSQQFKRNCLPDGVKVGRIALSPRGDWRMPSDATLALLN